MRRWWIEDREESSEKKSCGRSKKYCRKRDSDLESLEGRGLRGIEILSLSRDVFSSVGSVDARIRAVAARWMEWDGHRARRKIDWCGGEGGGRQAQGSTAETKARQTWRRARKAGRGKISWSEVSR
jgi:hypothetical protein